MGNRRTCRMKQTCQRKLIRRWQCLCAVMFLFLAFDLVHQLLPLRPTHQVETANDDSQAAVNFDFSLPDVIYRQGKDPEERIKICLDLQVIFTHYRDSAMYSEAIAHARYMALQGKSTHENHRGEYKDQVKQALERLREARATTRLLEQRLELLSHAVSQLEQHGRIFEIEPRYNFPTLHRSS